MKEHGPETLEAAAKQTAQEVARDIVNGWEAEAATSEADERPHLGRTILDRLGMERMNRNEKEMLELVRAITDELDNIQLKADFVGAEVDEALRHLRDQFDEYKSIEEV